MKAIWNDEVLAESDETIIVDGNHYFPADSVNSAYLSHSDTTSVCSWKGTSNYHNLVVDGQTNEDAAWYYSSPKDAAMNIKDHLAFWRGVEIVE
jgi:uncharacterized protein (DUF427 family)